MVQLDNDCFAFGGPMMAVEPALALLAGRVGPVTATETVPLADALGRVLAADRSNDFFLQMLFSKIVPNCRKLGLLDAGDGWLRQRFQEMGVIGFEHLADTSDEYEALDAFA